MPNLTIGGETISMQEFSGFKYLEALDLFTQMMEAVPELDEAMGKIVADFRERGTIVYSRTDALAARDDEVRSYALTLTDSDWEAAGNKLTRHGVPSGQDLFVRLFPRIYRTARPQVENLVCLLCTPNVDLERADEAGEGDRLYEAGGVVHAQRRRVLHGARLHEWMRIVGLAFEQLNEELQLGDLEEVAGKVRAAMHGPSTEESGSQPQSSESASEDPPASAPRSSKPSVKRSRAGRAGTSSTASPTAS